MLANLLKDIGIPRFSTSSSRLRRSTSSSAQVEPRFRQIFEHNAGAIFVVEAQPDRQFRFELLNRAAAGALEVTSDETAFVPTAASAQPVPADLGIRLHRCLRTGLPVKYEGRLSPSSDVYDVNLIPLADDNDNISYIFGFARDISLPAKTHHSLIKAQPRTFITRRTAERDAERKRIEHEMHNALGKVLAMLRMHIAVSRTAGVTSPTQSHHRLPMLDDAIHMVRCITATQRLKAPRTGITQTLKWLAEEFRGYSGIDYRLSLPSGEDFASPGMTHARMLLHTVQECLDNVAQHAEANLVEIALEWQGDYYRLEIKDDGKGFDLGARNDSALGLADIREHLLVLGGRLLLWSAPGQGTRVTAYIPFKEQLNKELHDSYIAG